ncbi:MAG: hypothetical protein HYS12_29885 [Planctomycetes bacterium]|nr:hypothetical protein [Planctomycetota bacterium]
MQTTQAETKTTESDIWVRLIQRNGNFPAEAARGILSLNFSDADKARMHELAQKNQEGQLSPAEREELTNYVLVGDVLSLLHLKARKSLKSK